MELFQTYPPPGVTPQVMPMVRIASIVQWGVIFLVAAGSLVADDKSALLQKMDSRAAHYGEVSRQIWEFAELGYKENRSAELLKSELRSACHCCARAKQSA